MKIAALTSLFFVVSMMVFPSDGYGYREEESEREVEADIGREEDALVGRLAEAGAKIATDTKRALKAEGRRDMELLRGSESMKVTAQKDDDSIAEIEREVDALTDTTSR